ncbi:arabinogalactan endo-1,4-beta-galactosidase [Sphingomonas sp. BGYR3]|uniref:arabinogalactan endo-1,4-beta-galactosidase n=1 Tax=Sphingomonas sp. BGYR3 TaxID=2975483 RepID=UPI0021A7DBB5|nr:arabinogalactan endo-1,4-beta-galactosidase [Sphingomonas sp. BGYR3]MDG5489759.1 arabinogalactan endo-1,4-beta-galactosidase [Sphingomonas sp. BGYR3]
MTRALLSRRDLATLGGGALLAAAAPRPAAAKSAKWPYLIGADVSWIPEDEAVGATYWQDGIRRDPLAILRDAGFNAIKLRQFVDPARGYSAGKPGGPWCDVARNIAFARRVRAADMHLSLTLHYSDTWADPEHQDKPAAWADLSFGKLLDAVHRHTAESLSAMKLAGVAPDMIVIGNETTFGMLWPEGRIPAALPTGNPVTDSRHRQSGQPGAHDRYAALLSAGLAAASDTVPDATLVLHNHLGRHWGIVQDWMDNLLRRDVRFDSIGLSCYQQQAQGDWERCFAQFMDRYPDHGLIVLEYSSRKRYLNDLVRALPRGQGSFIWEPTRHQEAIFLKNGVSAGEGPRPDLLSQGINAAEAPGSTPTPAAASTPRPPRDHRGRYDADPAFLNLYRTMAADYGLAVGKGMARP